MYPYLILVALVICIALAYWYKYRCIDQIDKIIMNPAKQLLALSLCVIFIFGLLIIIGLFAVGDTQHLDIIVFLYGLFSQTVSAYNPNHDISFQIFSLAVSIIGAVFFSGILVSTITNSILRRVDDYKKGKIHYKHLKKHNIIIGVNEILPAIINSYKGDNGKIIIVSEKSPNEIRRMLYNVDSNMVKKQLIIYNDHPHNPEVLRWLVLEKSKSITILGEHNICNNDTDNIIFLDSLIKYTKQPTFKSSSPIQCYISYYDSYNILNYCRNEQSAKVRIIPFNFYASCINNVWGIGQLFNKITKVNQPNAANSYNYIPLFDGKYKHIVILGYSACAEEVIKFILLNAHYVNEKTEIILVTTNTAEVEKFKYKSHIDNVEDIVFIHKTFSECSEECSQFIETYAESGDLYIVCCNNNTNQNILLSNNLPKIVFRHNIPVLIKADYFMPCNAPLDEKGNPLSHIKFFGHFDQMIFKTINPELALAQCIKYIHARKFGVCASRDNSTSKEYATMASNFWFGEDCMSKQEDCMSKQIDLPKINMLSRISFINTIFDLMNVEICKKEDGLEFEQVLPVEAFLPAFHYQQCAFYILHGYTANDKTNYRTKEVSQITSYRSVKHNKKTIESYTRFYNDIKFWLEINNLGCRIKQANTGTMDS